MITVKKNGKKSWVTFTYSPKNSVNSVFVSGEWNDWKEEPMKQKKSGDYYITKVLKSDSLFQFGYKLDNKEWVLEEECKRVDSPFASYNSLLEL